MKRLTRRFTDGTAFVPNEIKALHNEQQEYIEKLAAYEDTGLEPEEIKSNEQIIADLTRAVCLKDKKIKKLKELLKKAVEDLQIMYYLYMDDCGFCNNRCPFFDDKKDECAGQWKHADEVEEILKDEV